MPYLIRHIGANQIFAFNSRSQGSVHGEEGSRGRQDFFIISVNFNPIFILRGGKKDLLTGRRLEIGYPN
jgi:hypothetical protein